MAPRIEPPSERRKHPRFKSRDGAFAVLQNRETRLGRVVDVSLGGLAFHYVDGEGPNPVATGMLDIFTVGSSVELRRLPVRTLSDIPLGDPAGEAGVRRCGVAFLMLAPAQRETLGRLMSDPLPEPP